MFRVFYTPTPFASFPFTSPPVRQREPSRFNWTLTRPKIIVHCKLGVAELGIRAFPRDVWFSQLVWNFKKLNSAYWGATKFMFRPVRLFQHQEGRFLGREAEDARSTAGTLYATSEPGRLVIWSFYKVRFSHSRIYSSYWDINTRRYCQVLSVIT